MDVKILLKFIGLFILGISIFILSACSDYSSVDDCTYYDYSDCNTIEPEKPILSMDFTINVQSTAVPYEIFKGNVDDGVLLRRDTAHTSHVDLLLDEWGYYSVKAEYVIGGKKLYAIDGDELKKWETTKCDSVCWETRERSLKVYR